MPLSGARGICSNHRPGQASAPFAASGVERVNSPRRKWPVFVVSACEPKTKRHHLADRRTTRARSQNKLMLVKPPDAPAKRTASAAAAAVELDTLELARHSSTSRQPAEVGRRRDL